MPWKKNQLVYDSFVSAILENIQEECMLCTTEKQIIDYAKNNIYDYVEALPVKKLVQIHEYLMYMAELKPDPRFPTYVYSGGDRIISVTRYFQKHIDLILAKQYA